MNKYLKLLLSVVIALGTVVGSRAESANAADTIAERPVTQIYMLETGGKSVLDTYLSPLRYNGVGVALSGRWSKVLPWMRNSWQMHFDCRVGGSRSVNPAGNLSMLGLEGEIGWGAGWWKILPNRLKINVGASVGMTAGVLYMAHNSNNPASVKARAGISIDASLAYPFRLGRVPVVVSDEVSLPTLGAMFSPEYGETYYEIYLGNHSGLAHFSWWGNNFCIDNLLAFDLDIGPSALRLGYRYTLYSSWVCNLNTQIHSNSFVIGWIPHGLGLRKTQPTAAAKRIYSVY